VARDLLLLLALVLSGAAWLLAHLILWMRVLQATRLPAALRWLAWLPPVLPLAAWRAGLRTGVVLWSAAGIAYSCLRALA
jgi:hypothetical protein